LANLILRGIAWLSHLLVQNSCWGILAGIRIKTTYSHWVVTPQIWLIQVLKLLRLGNISSVILSICKSLPARWLRFSISGRHIWVRLLISWNLLCVIFVEKVHSGRRARRIFEINFISRLLYKLSILGNHSATRLHSLVHLTLTLINMCYILRMTHFIPFAPFPIIGYLISSLMIAIIIEACARESRPVRTTIMRIILIWSLLIYIWLSWHATSTFHYVLRCIIHAHFSRIYIIIILYVDLAIYVTHVLLLMVVLHHLSMLRALAILLLIHVPLLRRTILLIRNIRQSALLRIWNLSWLRRAQPHIILLTIVHHLIRIGTFAVILMKASHAAWTGV